MFVRRVVISGISLLILWMVWHLSSRVMVVQAIAPPNASMRYFLAAIVHPPYQMATPHRTLLSSVKARMVPSVQAACMTVFPPTCTGEESKPFCGEGDCLTRCPNGNCYCPGCTISPGCTVYCCTYVGKNPLCHGAFGKKPCQYCELDSSSTRCTPSN